MSRTTITLEIDPAHEPLLREYAAFLDEMTHLAPHGTVLAVCAQAVAEGGREHQRHVRQQALQARVEDGEKKGRR